MFGIHAAGTSVEGGKLNIAAYQDVATQLSSRFPRARFVAITLRESFSADYNKWGGMLYDCGGQQAHWAPVDASGRYAPYEIGAIVDRFGGGDSFCAGLLVALAEMPPSEAIRFAVAASALKHTIRGDFNYSSRPEVEALMGGSTSGRVKR
ncbi:MAG TPA: PfkB family carbohydrate kinase [Lentisphaeria bacterium]|nr:PfkB family carbohydrate kinase [Lentisphaeria bacterium]